MKSRVSLTMPDELLVVFLIGTLALLVGVGCLGWIAWENGGSRNMALGAASLIAAAFLFFVQIPFELHSKADTSLFAAEYTIDRLKPEIRMWSYPDDVTWRIGFEIDASNNLAKTNPDAFKGDGTKLTQDMAVLSLASYFFTEQFDWQIRQVRIQTPTVGTSVTTESLSKPSECSTVTAVQLLEMLAKAHNLFASGSHFPRHQLCLPPRSSIEVKAKSFLITNPFVRISFEFEPTGPVLRVKPRTHSLEAPALPDGSSQFETRAIGLRVTVEYTWIRAQHRDIDKYRAWAERVVNGAQRWFVGPAHVNSVPRANDGSKAATVTSAAPTSPT